MEPLQNDSPEVEQSTPDTGADPGLAEATAALESVMGGERPSAPEREPAAAPPPGPPAPAAPSRWDQHRQYQDRTRQSYRQRQEERRRQVTAMQEERRLLTEQTRQANAVMQQMLDHLRGLQGPKEEEIPDPLDPRFGAWLKEQNEKLLTGALDERLRPALDFIAEQRERAEQTAQEQQDQEHREGVARAITSDLESFEQQYLQEAPDVAVGSRDRLETMREHLMGSFVDAGEDPGRAQGLCDSWIYAIAADARSRGENPVAKIDAVLTALAMRLGGLEPVGQGDGPVTWGGNGHQPPPPPAPRNETSRLAAVQQRARASATAAPRVASRENQPKSELQELVRAGVVEMKRLKAAALRDAGGNMKEAYTALARVAEGGGSA